MRLRVPILLLPLIIAATGTVGLQRRDKDEDNLVQSYFDALIPVVTDTILHQNAGPSIGADPGVTLTIIPDPTHPDFSLYYVRDASILHHAWLNRLMTSSDPDSKHDLRVLLDDAVLALIRTQHIENPSGNLFTGGLDEPAFDLPLVEVTDATTHGFIGAPAGDTSPSRAVVLIKFAQWLTKPEQNNGTWVTDILWPAIDTDLQWILLHWNQSSWDLWAPPVWAGSYWTASLQYRALLTGAHLGRKIGRAESISSFESQAKLILAYLQTFWNEEKGFMSETTVTNVTAGGRSGIGAAPLTVSVLNFDTSLGCDSATFQPCSERALLSLKFLIDAYRLHYPINQNIPNNEPVLLGGFLEDSFLGGGAQYFSTFNSAEQLLDAVHTWSLLGELNVTKQTVPFFRLFVPDVRIGTYRPQGDGSASNSTFDRLIDGITKWAGDTFILLSKHTPADYVLPLSINGTSGEPYGPRGSLRSMAAALTARDVYNGLVPPSWTRGGYTDKTGNDDAELAERMTCGSEVLV